MDDDMDMERDDMDMEEEESSPVAEEEEEAKESSRPNSAKSTSRPRPPSATSSRSLINLIFLKFTLQCWRAAFNSRKRWISPWKREKYGSCCVGPLGGGEVLGSTKSWNDF